MEQRKSAKRCSIKVSDKVLRSSATSSYCVDQQFIKKESRSQSGGGSQSGGWGGVEVALNQDVGTRLEALLGHLTVRPQGPEGLQRREVGPTTRTRRLPILTTSDAMALESLKGCNVLTRFPLKQSHHCYAERHRMTKYKKHTVVFFSFGLVSSAAPVQFPPSEISQAHRFCLCGSVLS